MERRLFNRRELPILLVMVLAAALWLVLSRIGPEGTRAIVERDGLQAQHYPAGQTHSALPGPGEEPRTPAGLVGAAGL